ncbi:MAG: hypothetical protein KDD70_11650 [Bdellovibrionales bacterium]|nr:hypothetical protein [Bdellovibrionales bacterium]
MHSLERQIVYLLVIIIVSIPIMLRESMTPADMKSGQTLFDIVDGIEATPGKIAILAFDFGPNTKAENEPQAEVVLEHLLRKRVPVALFTLYAPAEGFLKSIPERVVERLERENPDERYEYGEDWVNLGYQPGMSLFVQSLAKSKDLRAELKRDVFGSPLKDLPIFKDIETIRQVSFLGEFTGLVGVFDIYVQFFQQEGFIPVFGHGCTSITIPEAYIYLDSGQLHGLLEGIAGAAWYSKLLKDEYPNRPNDDALVTNTALGIAHLVIIFLIIVGNGRELFRWLKSRTHERGAAG